MFVAGLGEAVSDGFAAVVEEQVDGIAEVAAVADAFEFGVVALVGDHGGVDGGHGPKGLGFEGAESADVAGGLEDDGELAERFGGGGGGHAVGDFGLDGDVDAVGRVGAYEEVDDEGRGDLVGEVGDEEEAAWGCGSVLVEGVEDGGCEGAFAGEDVGLEEGDVVVVGELLLGDGGELGIDFDGDDVAGVLGEQVCQGAGSGAYFEDEIVGFDVGGVDEESHEVEVDEEVLAPFVLGLEACVSEEGLELLFCGRHGEVSNGVAARRKFIRGQDARDTVHSWARCLRHIRDIIGVLGYFFVFVGAGAYRRR